MPRLDRRTVLAGLAAAAVWPAQATPRWPLVPPLPPLDEDLVARMLTSVARYEPVAAMLPEPHCVLYQCMTGMRLAWMAFPHADAVARLEAIAERWPRLRRNVDLTIAARLRGETEVSHENWNYQNVRIDGGPPRDPT